MRVDRFPAADRNKYLRRRGIGRFSTEHLSGMDVIFIIQCLAMKGESHECDHRRSPLGAGRS